MPGKFVVALLLAALAAPSAAAGVLEGCTPTPSVVGSPVFVVCKFHSGGSATCPGGAGSESYFVGTGTTGVGEADSGACDASSHRTGVVFLAVYSGSAQSFRWASGSGASDTREMTVTAGGAVVDWTGASGGPCSIELAGPASLHENCLVAAPPGVPGLAYGALYP